MIAATHLVLAAESLGLSSCFLNGWIEDKVKAVIGAADHPIWRSLLSFPSVTRRNRGLIRGVYP